MIDENEPFVPPLPSAYPEQVVSPKRSFALWPLVAGFLFVMVVAAAIGVSYYKLKLTATPSVSPSPTVSAVVVASAKPSLTPSSPANASAIPSASVKPSIKPVSAIKPTPKPTATPSPTPTPTPTPAPITLDVRFGNPSGHVKQTIDEGSGSGRVINREFSSIQSGEFDEVALSWLPRVTTCFHLVADESVEGSKIKYKLSVDDKVEVEDTMGWLGTLEAGKIYDWCHDVTTNIGKHTVKLILNPDSALKERNYVNNTARIDWENLADKTAPNITLGGPFDWSDKGTCFIVYAPSDNVNTIAELKIEQKVDGGNWAPIVDGMYCFQGTTGSSHTYAVHALDKRNNVNEQQKTFVLY